MRAAWSLLLPLLLFPLMTGENAQAADATLALGEVSVTNSVPGVDRATVKTEAEGELRRIEARLPARAPERRVVVSVAVKASEAPFTSHVNATLRDRKTGTMLAILEGNAHVEGDASLEMRRAVVRAAMKTAVSQIPLALSDRTAGR